MKQIAKNTWQIIEDDYQIIIDDEQHRISVYFYGKSPVYYDFESDIRLSHISKVMDQVAKSKVQTTFSTKGLSEIGQQFPLKKGTYMEL